MLRKPHPPRLWIPLLYVAAVLTVDTLAVMHVTVPIPWRMFQWSLHDLIALFQKWDWLDYGTALKLRRGPWVNFDCFKFLFWLVIPFAACIRAMDWGWFGLRRLKKWDYILLGMGVLAGVLILFIIPLLPSLREYYPSQSARGADQKVLLVVSYLIWTASWLVGWEFLHRYVLVRAVGDRLGGWGWLIVPFSEGLYHIFKSPWECAGMVLFSLLATFYVTRRKNMVVPFLVHLAIEMALPLFIVLV